MLKTLTGHNLLGICLFPVFLCACNGGSSSSANPTSLQISQNIPNLYLEQNWQVKVSASGKLSESIEVILQSPYGVLTSPSTVTLTPESPVASFSISGNLVCVACKISATSSNYTTAYSNSFDVNSGQLPDYGGLSDLEIATGSYQVFAASTGGHIYKAQIDPVTESSSPWEQVSTIIPDSSAILDMNYDWVAANVYAITGSGNAYVSTSGASSWKPLGGGELPDNSISNGSQIDATGNLFVGANNGFIYATSLSGNWQAIASSKLPDGGLVTTEYGIYVTSVANGVESVFVGSSKGNIYVSSVNPITLGSGPWLHVSSSSVSQESEEISAISINPTSGNIYAGTNHGRIYYSLGVNGNWSKLLGDLGGNTSMIVVDSATSDVYTLIQYGAATFSAYYSLAPSFDRWSNFGDILPESMSDGCTVSDVVTSFPGTNLQFAGTNCGNVYFSTYGFKNWKTVGMPK